MVRENFIWKGQGMLEIVYFMRPEPHRRMKPWLTRVGAGLLLEPDNFWA